jgi:hypothetical protein
MRERIGIAFTDESILMFSTFWNHFDEILLLTDKRSFEIGSLLNKHKTQEQLNELATNTLDHRFTKAPKADPKENELI